MGAPSWRPPLYFSAVVWAASALIGCMATTSYPAEFRVILQVALQRWMVAYAAFVVNQVGILADLLGNFRMSVEELVEPDGGNDASAKMVSVD